MGVAGAAPILLALSIFILVGCEDLLTLNVDLLNVGGRSGAQPAVSYDTLMRIAAAAHSGGDFANAVAIYRQAAILEPQTPAPFVAAGNTLSEMGEVNEAILAYKSALNRSENDPEALRGLAKAYLKTGRPELAGAPLAVAYQNTPGDPKLLQLVGVADDLLGQHREAQARYRRGLELAPGDFGLTLDLALSFALTGEYDAAIARMAPIVSSPLSTRRVRQTAALIYGLKGDRRAAERLAQIDLEPSAVQHNLAYYDRLRQLSPEVRSQALRSLGSGYPVSAPDPAGTNRLGAARED